MRMDLINECESKLLDFGDQALLYFESLAYSAYSYEDSASGKGHYSFILNWN